MQTNRTVVEEENNLLSSIKNEIDQITDNKLHALYQKKADFIDREKVAEESRVQFFEELTHALDNIVHVCEQFYAKLKIEDPFLYAKMEKAIEAVLEKIAVCTSVRELIALQKPLLSEGDKKRIYSLALKYFKNEDFESAYLFFTFLSLLEPQDSHIWLGRAMIEQNLGRYEEALISYNAVLSIAPENLAAYLHIIETLLLMKRFEEALQVYESFKREIDVSIYAHNAYVLAKIENIKSFLTVTCVKRGV